MTRHANPNTGNIVYRAETYVESTGVVSVTCAAGFLAIVPGIPLAINVSVLFVLMSLPVLVYVLLALAVYLPFTTNLRKSTKYTGHYFEAKYKVLPKLEKMEKDMAMPMVRKIFDHTVDNHPGQDMRWDDSECKVCMKRVKVLRELVPNKSTDESDMEYARLWIEEKKKFMEKLNA